MISVRQVAKSFGPRTLWRDVSVEVPRGEMLALTGPSGCGKSTLLNCVGLLERVDAGEILIDGRIITACSGRQRRLFRRDCLGYLFQNYALIENASVEFNLKVAVGARGAGRRNKDVFTEALQRVGLADRAKEMVYRLSGGEQQRVALARLMVKAPSVVLADEPTGALDHDNAAMVMATLRSMATAGCAVMIATHSNAVVDECDAHLLVGHSSRPPRCGEPPSAPACVCT
ncbi:MAG: ABC transporter ATP-binding protein [Micromonosporaceae bacterium]|nr:ABC transporter ATP-binding protein [Micromonosporaceae bacterium]